MPNYCPECGTKVRDSSNFCDSCGAELHSGTRSPGTGSTLKRGVASVVGLTVIAAGLSSMMDFALAVVIATGIVFAVMYWYYYQIGKVEQAAKQNS
ncbi:zinc-ribbon domain-containing protein [Halorientalis persicus]|nr:zinc ribbon domain-containing protein [Halorientalis persicus]